MSDGTNRDGYDLRIQRVIGYICAHLQDDLSVNHLSEVAGFSKFHFHRQFTAHAGFTVAQFVRLTRLKRAAYQLAYDPKRSILDIALDAGFGAPESFARAFKDTHGQTPSDFRRSPQWAHSQSGRRRGEGHSSRSLRGGPPHWLNGRDRRHVHALYASWLPQSGEQLRDFPCFFHYIERMPDVAEHEQVTDVYLPLR